MDREEMLLDFVGLRLALMDLEERYNRRGEKLAFATPGAARAWPGLWEELERLAREGLGKADKHRGRLSRPDGEPSRLREDGDFWFKLFLLIGSASAEWASRPHPPALPLDTIESIQRSLIAITEYTASGESEIQQRNGLALNCFLTAFPGLGPAVEAWADGQPPCIAGGMARAAARAARQAGMPDILKRLVE